MIIDFTIKNYRSFKETSSLSLLAEPLKNDGIAISTTAFGDSVLPVAGIFGQNAGGKSNVIKALAFMVYSILNTNHINAPINKHPLLQPFLLNENSRKEPVHFEIALWDNKTISQYNYGFEVDGTGVVAEWLELVDRPQKNRRSRLIFERNGNKFTFDKSVESRLKPLVINVLGTALAVNVFGNLAEPISHRLLELVNEQNIKLIDDGTDTNQLTHYALDRCFSDTRLQAQVIDFIKKSDIDINDVSIDRTQMSIKDLPAGFPEELKSIMAKAPQSTGYNYRIESKHSVYDNNGNKTEQNYNFNFGDESLGTQKIFALAVILLDALNKGETIVFDELGSSLHPFLTKKIVELFQSPKSNKHGAQLIFTSHETFLLNKNPLSSNLDLRRDQIWFADKGADEASVLRCLSEYKTKKEYELAKRYLEGRFGAVPVLKFEED